jgi:hypothetical protein
LLSVSGLPFYGRFVKGGEWQSYEDIVRDYHLQHINDNDNDGDGDGEDKAGVLNLHPSWDYVWNLPQKQDQGKQFQFNSIQFNSIQFNSIQFNSIQYLFIAPHHSNF